MSYNGALSAESERYNLRELGYAEEIILTYNGMIPEDFDFDYERATGWEIRAALKDWCEKNGIKDFHIRRAREYHRDLHGPRVYELWIKRNLNVEAHTSTERR